MTAGVLLLVRHGEARPVSPSGDAGRELTETGLREAGSAGLAIARLGMAPARVFASPVLRARRTAEEIVRAAGVAARIETAEALLPDAPPDEVLRLLAMEGLPADGGAFLCVGHNPNLSRVLSSLVSGEDSDTFGMRTGEMARVDLASIARTGRGTRGVLVWLLPPEVTAVLAGARVGE